MTAAGDRAVGIGAGLALALVAVHLVTGAAAVAFGVDPWEAWLGQRSSELRIALGGRYLPRLAAEPWRCATAPWLHVDLLHLTGNALSTWVLGDLVAPALGRHAVRLYLLGGVGAAVCSSAVGVLQSDGASGAVSAWLGFAAWASLRPTAPAEFVALRRPLWLISFADLVFPAALLPIDLAAHVGGFVIGAFWAEWAYSWDRR